MQSMLIFSIRDVAFALQNTEPVLQQPPWPNACHLNWSFISEVTFQVKKIKIHFIAVLAVDSENYIYTLKSEFLFLEQIFDNF